MLKTMDCWSRTMSAKSGKPPCAVGSRYSCTRTAVPPVAITVTCAFNDILRAAAARERKLFRERGVHGIDVHQAADITRLENPTGSISQIIQRLSTGYFPINLQK